jgi:hypothetical protein
MKHNRAAAPSMAGSTVMLRQRPRLIMLEVLSGAVPLLQEQKIHFIYAECEPVAISKRFAGFSALTEFLTPLGYRVFGIYDQRLEPAAGNAVCFWNVLFMCAELVLGLEVWNLDRDPTHECLDVAEDGGRNRLGTSRRCSSWDGAPYADPPRGQPRERTPNNQTIIDLRRQRNSEGGIGDDDHLAVRSGGYVSRDHIALEDAVFCLQSSARCSSRVPEAETAFKIERGETGGSSGTGTHLYPRRSFRNSDFIGG